MLLEGLLREWNGFYMENEKQRFDFTKKYENNIFKQLDSIKKLL